MIQQRKAKDGNVSFYVRVGNGPSTTFNERDYRTRTEAKAAAKKHEADLILGKRPGRIPTIETYCERVLDHWANETLKNGRHRKASTMAVLEQNLKAFREKFGSRIIGSIPKHEARDWALKRHRGEIKAVTQLYNRALDEYEDIGSNPFRGLAPSTRGRSDEVPPTPAEFDKLLDAWKVHDTDPEHPYSPMGRALQLFAGHTGMRPGELFALEWDDIDFDARRINVQRRVWKGTTDLPKSNKTRRIVLTSEARDALVSLPHVSQYVFVSKRGNRLSQSALSIYWAAVRAKAGVDKDFYLVTKHMCVHRAYVVERKSAVAIAGQMGWSVSATEKLLAVYGHGDVGWEAEWEENVVELRRAK